MQDHLTGKTEDRLPTWRLGLRIGLSVVLVSLCVTLLMDLLDLPELGWGPVILVIVFILVTAPYVYLERHIRSGGADEEDQ